MFAPNILYGLYRDNGKGDTGIMEKKMDTILMGLYRDNGKEDGNYDNGVIQGSWKRKWTPF